MVNNYWCDVSKISLVFYYLYNVKGVLAAVAFRLKLLLSKCLQCNYIHTLMTEKCARKEKLEIKISIFIESGHLSHGVWRGKSAMVLHGAAGRFLSKHSRKLLLHQLTSIFVSWLRLLQGGWGSAGTAELLLTPTLTSEQNCTSPARPTLLSRPARAAGSTENSHQGLTILHQIKWAEWSVCALCRGCQWHSEAQ